MNLATIKRRLETLESKRDGGRMHVISARDGDIETVERLKRGHIEAGLAHESDLFVIIRRISDWPHEPSIHTHATRSA